jgi:hypothetical protein
MIRLPSSLAGKGWGWGFLCGEMFLSLPPPPHSLNPQLEAKTSKIARKNCSAAAKLAKLSFHSHTYPLQSQLI